MTRLSKLVKRSVDVVAGTVGLAVTAPVMLATAAAIRTTIGRPVLFRQRRPGLHGEPFELMKFRTMRVLRPGEEMLKTDAERITRLGRLLRATSLDELPTLVNVLRGEMSLVGPRPLLMRYVPRYSKRQARRHEVKPGVTGWAQVNGRNSLEWGEKLELDVWYVEHQSLLLDLKILAMTLGRVIRRQGINASGEATTSEFMGTENHT